MLPELVPLPLLGLGDLRHHKLFPGQLLEQLLQDLQTIMLVLSTNMSFTIKTTKSVSALQHHHYLHLIDNGHLAVVEILLDVLDNDPLRVQLVVHPLDQDAGDWGLDQTLFV